MYKAIFSDFDGTLLTSEHKISPNTLIAIQRISKDGIPFIPISARSPLGMLPYVKQLGNGKIDNIIVSFGGALILDKHFQPIYSVQIPFEEVVKIDNVLRYYPNLGVNYYINNDCFSRDIKNKWVELERKITGIKIDQTEKSKLHQPHKIQVIGEIDEIIEIESQLRILFPNLNICRSHANFLEIMNNTASKGNSVRFLENYLGINKEEAIAFGDNFNDVDMLQNVGLGVAMENAPQEVKNIANRITASNNEDGIALILNEFFPE